MDVVNDNSGMSAEVALAYLLNAARDRCEAIAVALLGNPASADRREMRWSSTYDRVLDLREHKRGLWYDFNSSKGGNIMDLVRDVLGLSREQAIDWLRRELAMPAPEKPQRRPADAE